MKDNLYALINIEQSGGVVQCTPVHISTDLPVLQKQLREKLLDTVSGKNFVIKTEEVLAVADRGERGSLLLDHYDTLMMEAANSVFTGFRHIRRSNRGPSISHWEIQLVPAWKLDPPPAGNEPLVAIHMNEQCLQGVYSNLPGGVRVVYIDEDKELYEPNPETDTKLSLLNTLVKEGLVREIYYCHEGTAEDLKAALPR